MISLEILYNFPIVNKSQEKKETNNKLILLTSVVFVSKARYTVPFILCALESLCASIVPKTTPLCPFNTVNMLTVGYT